MKECSESTVPVSMKTHGHEVDVCGCRCWKWTLSLLGWENENCFLFPSISTAGCLSFQPSCLPAFSVALTHILCTHAHIVHAFVPLHMHRNKCQASSPWCGPQVMHAQHFVKTTAQESHHKLLLTDADSPMAHHSIHYTESHCNFLSSARLPSTLPWCSKVLVVTWRVEPSHAKSYRFTDTVWFCVDYEDEQTLLLLASWVLLLDDVIKQTPQTKSG